MYRSIINTINSEDKQKEAYPLLGLDSFNMKHFQEMFLDTSTPLSSSPCISPMTSSTSGPVSPLSASSISPFSPQLPSQQQQHSDLSASAATTTATSSLGATMLQQMPNVHNNTTNIHLHQQQFLFQQQQQMTAAAMAQQQLALAAAAFNSNQQQQQQDEISKSLKTFAMSYKTGNETPHDIDDFACNGYVCDDRYQKYQTAMQIFNQSSGNNGAAAAAISGGGVNTISQLQQLQLQQQQQILLLQKQHQQNSLLLQQQLQNTADDVRNNLWMLPTAATSRHHHHNSAQVSPAASATAAAAFNIEFNNNKKPHKRFNGTKNDKYSAAKHCVFCENNNEPDAVVKSHAVRDTLGRVLCPKLRTYICPICKASGDFAHTVKYCPQKPIITMEDAIKADSIRLSKVFKLMYPGLMYCKLRSKTRNLVR